MQRGFRRDLHQIAVALFVLRQHQQMVIRIALGRRALDVVIVFLADVKLAAHDRLDARMVRSIDEVYRAENITVVGHRHGRHAQLFHAVAKLFDVASAIKKRVVGMQVQMDKLGHRLRSILRWRHSNGKGSRTSAQLIHS